MSYTDYDGRYHQRPRHESYTTSRDVDAYSRMRGSANSSPYSSSLYDAHEPYPPPLPRRSAAPPQYRTHPRKQTWPPSPSVEEETASLAKEALSSVGSSTDSDGEPPVNTRGTVDQESLLDEIEQRPTPAYEIDDRRFVLVSDNSSDNESRSRSNTIRDRRRKSFAERGNMPYIRTDIEDPPVFTERVSTPYAYTKPQKESLAPSPGAFLRSPEPMTPATSTTPRSAPSRHAWDAQKDQNARPLRPSPTHSRHNSFSKSRHTPTSVVFDDSDIEPEDTTRLRADRKPARYSFVKSDLQKEDFRTNLRDTVPKSEPRRRDSGRRSPTLRKGESAGSSRDSPYAQSPRSSSSSVNSSSRKSRPVSIEPGYPTSSRPPSRPHSPLQQGPSPKLPTRLRESPPSTRPSSRGSATPASPLSFSTSIQPLSPGRAPATHADWHATYPPVTTKDRSRPPSRYGRYDTMPVPTPRIDVQSPSPRPEVSLPYPVDDRPLDVFMPSEGHYQFDHSSIASPRQAYPESPRPSSTTPYPQTSRDPASRAAKQAAVMPDESTHMRRTRSNSFRSQASQDERQEQFCSEIALLDAGKVLPDCPRPDPTSRYNDWYSLHGHRGFDICPSCYLSVFADTPFAVEFSQTRSYDQAQKRFCGFGSVWMRLAWLLTFTQRRANLDLLYALADVTGDNMSCPGNRERSTDSVAWYGVLDQKDGRHVANFAVCPCDKRMIDILFPSMYGCFTKLSPSYQTIAPDRYVCSLRESSRRCPKYLDLLVVLDAEAQSRDDRPNMNRFLQLARENAFKGECAQDKASFRKPWHFIPSFPELTVCQECFDELIWPATQSKSSASTIPRMFSYAIQLVPNEDPDVGSSCCLYSPRMRRIWEISIKEQDFSYLKQKVLERKRAEAKLAKEREECVVWLQNTERGSSSRDRAKEQLRALERVWAEIE